MADITLEQARAKLTTWLNADDNLAKGKSVAVDGQAVTIADTQEHIQYWQKEVRRLELQQSGSYSPFHNHGLAKFS